MGQNCRAFGKNLGHEQVCGWGSDSAKSGLLRREAERREVVKIVDVRDDKDLLWDLGDVIKS